MCKFVITLASLSYFIHAHSIGSRLKAVGDNWSINAKVPLLREKKNYIGLGSYALAQCLARGVYSTSSSPLFSTCMNMSTPPENTKRLTNNIVSVINGINHKRLGGGDIIVSEIGLGTQRWCR